MDAKKKPRQNFLQGLLQKVAFLVAQRMLSAYQVDCVDGIRIVDWSGNPQQRARFHRTVVAALELIRKTDPVRYRRVQRRLDYIVQQTLSAPMSGEYVHRLRACNIDYLDVPEDWTEPHLVGSYASLLIHEATHGAIESRGIRYTSKMRSRIEHLCVREEQRFLLRLTVTQPELAEDLYQEYVPTDWAEYWKDSKGQQAWKTFQRIWRAPETQSAPVQIPQ